MECNYRTNQILILDKEYEHESKTDQIENIKLVDKKM